MNLEVRHLQLTVAVAAEGSLTKAGERLHLTQSALSHQLRDLESRLGTPIFLRLKKRMVLTPAGEKLLAASRELLDQLQQTEDAVCAFSDAGKGILRISTECYTCYHWLPSLLKAFRQKFPCVEVSINVDATSRPLATLLDGKLDLAVVNCAPTRDRRIVFTPLFRDEMVAVMRPDHRLAARPFLRATDFAGENLVMYGPATDNYLMQRLLLPAGVMPGVLQVQLTEAILEMVKAGLGIAVLAGWAVQPYIDSRSLVARPVTRKGLHRQWSAAVLKEVSDAPYVVEFVKLLTNQALPARPLTGRSWLRAVVASGEGVSMPLERAASDRPRYQLLPAGRRS